jgi:hypothetical protein
LNLCNFAKNTHKNEHDHWHIDWRPKRDWSRGGPQDLCRFGIACCLHTHRIYAHLDFIKQQATHFDLQLPIERMHDQPKQGVLNVVDCWTEPFQLRYGEVDAKAGAIIGNVFGGSNSRLCKRETPMPSSQLPSTRQPSKVRTFVIQGIPIIWRRRSMEMR